MKYKIKQFMILATSFLLLFSMLFYVNNLPPQDASVLYNTDEAPYANIVLTPKELFIESWSLIKDSYWDRDLNNVDWHGWKKRYANKIETEEDAALAINTMLASLNDPYSKLLTKEEFKEQNSSIDSKIYGIGINIASVSGKIFIVNIIKGAPADAAGLKQGDMLLDINGNDVKGDSVFQVAAYIKGTQGSIVNLEILRNNKKMTKKIRRAEIKIKTVESHIIDKDIGYIRIISFIGSETPVEFIDALNKVKDTKAIILDLRGNTGGLFQNAVFVANMFLDDGNIVDVIGRGGNHNSYRAEKKEYVYKNPMVVLVDSESASASEIVSGALKDNNRAVIVGTKTFGKGLVQKVYTMPNSMGMNLTIARYLTPDGSDINKKGIEPNYSVQITKDDWEKNNDSQLNFAQNILKNELTRRARSVEFAKAGN